jgi:hypothetical protein
VLEPALTNAIAAKRVRCCVVGGAALAVHGYSRPIADVDLLTLDERVLHSHFWLASAPPARVHWGRKADPLRGLVRWTGAWDVDLYVSSGRAAELALATAVLHPPIPVPVATPLALTLLKLEAGGTSDVQDILALAAVRRAADGAPWLAQVPAELPRLSPDARSCWRYVAARLDGV